MLKGSQDFVVSWNNTTDSFSNEKDNFTCSPNNDSKESNSCINSDIKDALEIVILSVFCKKSITI
jgi:hypothetical protein